MNIIWVDLFEAGLFYLLRGLTPAIKGRLGTNADMLNLVTQKPFNKPITVGFPTSFMAKTFDKVDGLV
jgi:hypothetical protein